MTDKEKLVELLWQCVDIDTPFGEIADHLIANGVTFQKWIPVAERLPEDLKENKDKKIIPCLVAYPPYRNGRLVTQFRQRKYDADYGWYWPKMGGMNITHWMPLPEGPKEADE